MADTASFFNRSSAMTSAMLPVTTTLSVIIPTFRRAEGLGRALASAEAQDVTGVAMDIIVCDNSPEASARAQVAAFAATSRHRVIYVHEPHPGVANARNSAVAACTNDFIAFLDDDEEAPASWLRGLLKTQTAFDADVVFGPVEARLHGKPDKSGKTGRFDAYFTAFFTRRGPDSDQPLRVYYGCGNSLIRRACLPASEPFSVVQNNMGGEDDQLFHGLMASGAVMAWAADAPVFEDVPPGRATLSYTLLRAFAFGQGPSYTAALNHKFLHCAAWMAQGLIQGLVFGLGGAALLAAGRAGAAPVLDKAARGFGKLLWFEPFKIGFYGTALLKTKRKAP